MSWHTVKRWLDKESPALMTIAGVSGFISSAVMAVKATPEAMEALEQERPYIAESGRERYVAEARLLFPYYAPSIAMMLISTGLIMASSQVSKKRYMAVSSLYFASQQHFHRFQEKVLEEVGERKFEKIQDAAAEPTEQPQPTLVTGENVLCYDTFSDRYFRYASVEQLRAVTNDLNHTLYSDSFVPLNDFYYAVGLGNVTYGDNIGWSIEKGPLNIRLGSALTPDRQPCVTITFEIEPKHIYDRLLS